jgi:hypothetical protein
MPHTISSNTLFHFTDGFENIVDILTNEFCPRFCLEDLNVLGHTLVAPQPLEFAIPMVCFCDLPLSSTARHLTTYGNYGIGLTKPWGMNAGITPLLYTYPHSRLAHTFAQIVDRLNAAEKLKPGSEHQSVLTQLLDAAYDLSCLVKPYEGDFWRRGTLLPNVRFYDEREWRYVPILPQQLRYGLRKEAFLDPTLVDAANRVAGSEPLRFKPSDIRYIIVATEAEILPMMERIERIKSRHSYEDVRTLMSRIVSAEQIRTDF